MDEEHYPEGRPSSDPRTGAQEAWFGSEGPWSESGPAADARDSIRPDGIAMREAPSVISLMRLETALAGNVSALGDEQPAEVWSDSPHGSDLRQAATNADAAAPLAQRWQLPPSRWPEIGQRMGNPQALRLLPLGLEASSIEPPKEAT